MHPLRTVVLLLAVAGGSAPVAAGAADPEATLLASGVFRDLRVGIAGRMSEEARAFRRIVDAPGGVEAFWRIIRKGSPAGRVYALCGLFFLDPVGFQREYAALRESPERLQQHIGCALFDTTLHDVLKPTPGAPRLSAGADGLREWADTGAKAEVLDVAGGGMCYRLRYDP